MAPKVLIGIVTHGKHRFILDEFIQCLQKQTVKSDILFVVNNGESAYRSLISSKGFQAVEDPKKAETRIEKIINGRKYLREFALKNDYDYLMYVDSDILLPRRAVEFLLAMKPDVATGVFLSAFEIDGKPTIAPVLYKDLGDGQAQQFTIAGVAKPQIIDVGAGSLGCTMISRKVLEKVDIRAMGKSQSGGEDVALFVDARAAGFTTKAHTGIKCLHAPYPITDPRIKNFQWKTTAEDNTVDIDMGKY